jgi:hypothetical protein
VQGPQPQAQQQQIAAPPVQPPIADAVPQLPMQKGAEQGMGKGGQQHMQKDAPWEGFT